MTDTLYPAPAALVREQTEAGKEVTHPPLCRRLFAFWRRFGNFSKREATIRHPFTVPGGAPAPPPQWREQAIGPVAGPDQASGQNLPC